MKKTMLMTVLMFLVLAGISFAAGTYTVQIGDSKVDLDFVPGPYGPLECGTAKVYVDDVPAGSFVYRADAEDVFLTVIGLGTFFKTDDKLIFYQDLLGVPLVKTTD